MTIISDAQFAAMIGQDAHYVQQMRHDGRGPVYLRLSGKRCVYELAAIQEWIANHTIVPEEEREKENTVGHHVRRVNGKRPQRGYRRKNAGHRD